MAFVNQRSISMKKLVLVSLILIQSAKVFAQFNSDNISFEVRYPIPIGHNFINKGADKGYTGLIDFGIDYTVYKVQKLNVGVLLHASFFKFKPSDVNLRTIAPKLKADYEINLSKVSIVPQVAVGYSSFHFSGAYKKNSGGPAVKAATKIVFNRDKQMNWYFLIAYEFTKLKKLEDFVEDTSFNKNIQTLYPGVGITWNFKKG